MDDIRFIATTLDCYYEEVRNANKRAFKNEYDKLSEFETDDVAQWLKIAKAKGDLYDTDKVLLTLIAELHKKVDRLESLIKKEDMSYIQLLNTTKITGINFDYIKTSDAIFEHNIHYYARVPMPLFPKREIPMFLLGVDSNIAKIALISHKNLTDWNGYVTARERELIRELKRSFT